MAEQQRAAKEQFAIQAAQSEKETQRAWLALAAARDKAEVLVPPVAFGAFNQLYLGYEKAAGAHFTSEMMMAGGTPDPGAHAEMLRQVEEAQHLRPGALAALQALLDTEA
jgi:hypothetical protein